MNTTQFSLECAQATSKKDVMSLIVDVLSSVAVPAFGWEGEEGYPEHPFDGYSDDDRPDDVAQERKDVREEYNKAVRLVTVFAKKWEIPFDAELYLSTLNAIRDNDCGLWRASSIGC